MTRLAKALRMTALVALAGCGNMTCDQQKQESIKEMNVGVEAANRKEYAAAEKALSRSLSLDPENDEAAYNLGQVYVDQKKWDKAVETLSTAVKFNPKEAMYHYHLGHAYLELDNRDMARTELEEAIKLNKRLYKAFYHLGRVHALQERPKEAAVAWTESCRLNPTFGKAFYDLGKLYYMWDHYPESVNVLVQGAQYAKDPEDRSDLYFQLGMSYDALKQYDKSIEAYQKSIEERKDNIQARFQLGMAFAAKGDKPNARKYLEEFVKQGGGGNLFLIQGANDRLMKLTGE